MADCYVTPECEQNIHVKQPHSLDLGEKVLALPRPRPYHPRPEVKTFMRCPRGSSRPRPGLEDNKTGCKTKCGWERILTQSVIYLLIVIIYMLVGGGQTEKLLIENNKVDYSVLLKTFLCQIM